MTSQLNSGPTSHIHKVPGTYIKLGRSSGGSIFEKFQGGALFLSFIAFLCDNFKIFPNFSGSQGGPDPNTSPWGKGGGLSPLNLTYGLWELFALQLSHL